MVITALIAGMLLIGTGCSSIDKIKKTTEKITKRTTRKIADLKQLKLSDSGLKKVMAIGRIDNRSQFSSETLIPFLQQNIVKTIATSCSPVILITPGQSDYPDFINNPPLQQTGRIDNFQLAKLGRQYGLNAVLFGSIVDVSVFTDERGLFWFRDSHQFLQVLVNVLAYDMETAAKLFDESYLYETALQSGGSMNSPVNQAEILPHIEKGILEALSFLGDDICIAIRGAAWSGFIASVKDGRYILPAGSRIGLTMGQYLDVYGRGAIFEGVNGERFYQPGEKIGEIQIAEISANQSAAVGLPAQSFPVGSMVRAK